MHVTMRQLKRIIREELIREASAPAFAPTAAEEAARVNSQVSGMVLQTDQSYWEEYGISTGEELALSLLSSTYSDMYKSIHGIRPRWEEFNSPAEAQAAIDALDQEVEDMIAADELEAQQQAEYEKKEKEIQALMPGEFDFQHIPKRSGMGRRMENYIRITPNALKRLIKEVIAEDKEGKGACPKSGCITRSGDKWRIISNKTGKLWPQKYDTKEKAENALKAYHVHN